MTLGVLVGTASRPRCALPAVRRRSWPLAVALGVALLAGTGLPAAGQSLNDAVGAALANNCAVLGGPAGPYGPNLSLACVTPTITTGTAGGGSVTVENRVGGTEEERRVVRRMRERQAALSGLGVFATAEYQSLEKDRTRFETGYYSDILGATVGADYRFSRAVLAGLALNYTHEFGNFEDVGGGFDVDSFGPIAYASLSPIENLFIDLVAGYSRKEYDFERRASVALQQVNGDIRFIAGPTSADTDGNEFKGALNAGYDFILGKFTVGPRVGLNVVHTRIDGFRERGQTGLELIYDDQERTSVTSVVGVHGSVAVSTPIGVLVPQATLEYLHEFADDQRTIYFRFAEDLGGTRLRFQTDRPDRDYFTAAIGSVLVLPGGWSTFVNYRTLLGYSDRTSHTVSVGLRIGF